MIEVIWTWKVEKRTSAITYNNSPSYEQAFWKLQRDKCIKSSGRHALAKIKEDNFCRYFEVPPYMVCFKDRQSNGLQPIHLLWDISIVLFLVYPRITGCIATIL